MSCACVGGPDCCMRKPVDESAEPPPDFGLQVIDLTPRHPWVLPLLGAAIWVAFCLMLITGTAPWQ